MAWRLLGEADAAALGPQLKAWRVSTAIRVFVLALALGSVLGGSSVRESAPLLTALALTAAMAALAEARLDPDASAWVPLVEGTLCAIVLTQGQHHPDLLVYLAAPPTIAGLRAIETVRLPQGLNYTDLGGLSRELQEKLTKVAPETLGQASRIPGMTPTALALLQVHGRGHGRAMTGS